MSKPLYMQVSDLQNELNRARDRSDYVKEELAAAKAALASLAADLAATRQALEAARAYIDADDLDPHWGRKQRNYDKAIREYDAARAVLAGEDTT